MKRNLILSPAFKEFEQSTKDYGKEITKAINILRSLL